MLNWRVDGALSIKFIQGIQNVHTAAVKVFLDLLTAMLFIGGGLGRGRELKFSCIDKDKHKNVAASAF